MPAPVPDAPEWIRSALERQASLALMRRPVVMESPQSTTAVIDGRQYDAFCSNDYLGLAYHPELIAAVQKSVVDWGVGSGASHLVSGHSVPHQRLEEALADWLGYEAVMLFSTGYMANLGAIAALATHSGLVVQDKLNHASLIDGARLADAKLKRYLHCDLTSAKRVMQSAPDGTLLVTDGVFSMDGDIAPLRDLAVLAQDHQALLMVDDAHGLGCLGDMGRGSLSQAQLSANQVSLLVGTFGKAFGTSGAFVAGSRDMVSYLTQFARPYIYTTAMSPAIAAATLTSLMLICSDEGERRRQALADNIRYFRASLAELPVTLMASDTAIQPLIIGDSDTALNVAGALRDKGIWCTAIRPPTVPAGSARLRITLSADHTKEQIERLILQLTKVLGTQ